MNNRSPLIIFVPVILILWGMLLPGYVLTLDMPWVPEPPLVWNSDSFNNSYPVNALLYALTFVMPSWAVQKILLLALFFLLFYLPWKFIPFIKDATGRLFAAALFALNPFVYSRLLAGQWKILFAYALLPLFLHALVKLTRYPARRTALVFSVVLAAIGLFSVHFLYLSLLFSAIWIFFNSIADKKWALARYYLLSIFCLLLISLYWLAPALARQAPLEARFDAAHFEVFSAAANGRLGVLANLAALGGFWGEATAWKYYFVWPQESIAFTIASSAILALVGIGIYRGMRNKDTLLHFFILFIMTVFCFITASGASDTVFRGFNLFLYENMPLWNGLRDSHKIAGMLALLFSLFAGLGVELVLHKLDGKKSSHSFLSIGIFILPTIFGMYMWGGFHKQLSPVWYPSDWEKVKTILNEAQEGEKALVLPWHGYLSLDFADQKIVANPAPGFFGHDKIISSRSVESGEIYDQEVDPGYRALDFVINNSASTTDEELEREFKRNGIIYLLIIKNSATQSNLTLHDDVASSPYFPLTLFESDMVVLKSTRKN